MHTWWRLLTVILATAVTIHLAWMLVRPALPFLAGLISLVAGLICLIGLVHLIRWYRGRW